MTKKQAYDEKNQQDYKDVTDKINACIDKIEITPSLKPTIAELARVTGLHRNTLYNRDRSPQKNNEIKTRLNEIKRNRRIKKEIEKKVKKDQVKFLDDQLDNAKLELIHWFTKCSDIENENHELSDINNRLNDSLKFYIKELEEERKKNTNLKEELSLLKTIAEQKI